MSAKSENENIKRDYSRKNPGIIRRFIRHIFLLPVRLYKLVISPWLPNSCIYEPSCSSYAVKSVLKHGIFKGSVMSAMRIGRCNGFLFNGGMDAVPENYSFRELKEKYREFRKPKHID